VLPTDVALARASRSERAAAEFDERRLLSHLGLRFANGALWECDVQKRTGRPRGGRRDAQLPAAIGLWESAHAPVPESAMRFPPLRACTQRDKPAKTPGRALCTVAVRANPRRGGGSVASDETAWGEDARGIGETENSSCRP
jgi:hypothetical protein